MKIAIVGSRNLYPKIKINRSIDEIISGGAQGVDSAAKEYAKKHGIKFTEIAPDYERHGRGAPFIRNREIVDSCDVLYIYWDGKSRGTKFTMDYAKKANKKIVLKIIQ